MAFVFKSDRKPAYIDKNNNPELGPGSYIGQEQLQVNKAAVPFNSSKPRNDNSLEQKQQANMPGPGTYNIVQQTLNEKVVVSSANEDIKIVEVPKPQPVFKSNTNRFQQKLNENPGPGEYNVAQAIASVKQWPDSKQKRDIIAQLMKMNKYTSIPSIPGKPHTHGYTENQNNELELNKLPSNIHQGIQGDQIGPAQYSLKDFIEYNNQKGPTSWAKNRVERFQHQRNSKSVGPGQYDIQSQIMPLYKLKQSQGFASKTMRTSEQRKGQIANQFLKQKSIAQSDAASVRTRDQTEYEDSDSEYEYIEDATPGPGYYHNESVLSSIKPKTKQERFQFFGSGQVRFKEQKRVSHAGPGDYKGAERSDFKLGLRKQRVRNPPFLSSNTRFEQKQIQDKKPGPQTYDPKLNLEDKLIKKVEKGYRGHFGTTENRFKPYGLEEYPGPGAYLEPISEGGEEEKQPTHQFKSKVVRGAFEVSKEQKKKPPVGSYNINYYNIERAVHKDDEDDPELRIPRPAFGSSVEDRFNDRKIKEQVKDDDDDDDFETYPKDKSINTIFQKKPISNVKFGSKAERFNYKYDNNPGPQKYHDTHNNPWNKRTYNILFAEI